MKDFDFTNILEHTLVMNTSRADFILPKLLSMNTVKCYCRKKKEFVIDPVFQSEGGLLVEMKICTPHMPKDSKVSII